MCPERIEAQLEWRQLFRVRTIPHDGKQLSAAQLRLRVVNMKVLDPQTIMPAYYRVSGLEGVSREFVGKPILSAQQIEDLVAYLQTLK